MGVKLKGKSEIEHLSMFKNGVLRKTCGLMGQSVRGIRRKLHNEQLHYLYSAPNVTRFTVIKSSRASWQGNLTGLRDNRNTYRVSVGKPEENIHLENQAQVKQ